MRYFFQESRIIADFAPDLGRDGLKLLYDFSPALAGIDQNTVCLHQRQVISGLANFNVGRSLRTQATTGTPTLQTGILQRHHRVAQQGHQPANGPAIGGFGRLLSNLGRSQPTH